MAAATVKMQAPSTITTGSVFGASGATYTLDAYGQISGVSYPDIGPLIASGWTVIGVGRNNLSATTDPGASNDVSQDYTVGSLWINTTKQRPWRAVAVGTGAAIWQEEANGIPDFLTAVGSVQASATPFTAPDAIISVSTTSAKGIRLPAPVTGRRRRVFSNCTQGTKVYPSTGTRIGSTATNTAVVVAGFKSFTLVGVNTKTWALAKSA